MTFRMTSAHPVQPQLFVAESYWRNPQEITADESIALMTGLRNLAFDAGVEEEHKAAYSELCRLKKEANHRPRKRATDRK